MVTKPAELTPEQIAAIVAEAKKAGIGKPGTDDIMDKVTGFLESEMGQAMTEKAETFENDVRAGMVVLQQEYHGVKTSLDALTVRIAALERKG